MNPTPEQPLVVQELALALGVSVRYVYEMRRCDFPMRRQQIKQMATVREAMDWIRQNEFKIRGGYGVMGKAKG